MVKQQKKLLIIISFIFLNQFSYSQFLSSQDSSNFKREFEALLKKYKLDDKGYKISVQSSNQSGGQTAFIITNNYYKDPNLIADSINYIYLISMENQRKVLTIYPKSGAWVQPILFYDSSDIELKSKIYPLPAMYAGYFGTLRIANNILSIKGSIFSTACTFVSPIHIYLNDKPNEYYYFGDNTDTNKRYFYSNGKVIWVPLK